MSDSCVFFWSLAPSECASWVQAWGTMAALAVSIGVWWWQSERARWDRVQAEIDRLTERAAPALGLLDGMLQELEQIVKQAESQQGEAFRGWGGAFSERFRALLDEYQKVEAHLLPDAALALEATQAKESGVNVRNWLALYDPWSEAKALVMERRRVLELKGYQLTIHSCCVGMRLRLLERTSLIINPDTKALITSRFSATRLP